MRQVAQIMGMPITIDIPNTSAREVFDLAFARLRQIDEQFSTYKAYSEVSRYSRGELDEVKASLEFKEVLQACRGWKKKTDGYFSAWYQEAYDPSGYVKGWAIERVAELIKTMGYGTFCISAGGDILAASNGEKSWSIGVQDPQRKNSIIKTVEVKNGAVATSGSYERGPHIIDPKTNQPANHWASVTVIGPDIITADVLATACFAASQKAPGLFKKWPKYKMLAVVAGEEVGNNPLAVNP